MNRAISQLSGDMENLGNKFAAMEGKVNKMAIAQAEANTKIRMGAFVGGLVGSGVITLVIAIATKSI